MEYYCGSHLSWNYSRLKSINVHVSCERRSWYCWSNPCLDWSSILCRSLLYWLNWLYWELSTWVYITLLSVRRNFRSEAVWPYSFQGLGPLLSRHWQRWFPRRTLWTALLWEGCFCSKACSRRNSCWQSTRKMVSSNLGKPVTLWEATLWESLRIPEGDVTATAKTICNSQSLDSCPQPNIVRQLVTVPDVWETSQNTSPKPSNDVDELAHKISESSIIADGSHEESSVESRGTIDNSSLEDNDKVANKKPINWFSALPPQSLRQAQTCFVSSLQLAAACVSMQEELDVLNQHYLEAKKLWKPEQLACRDYARMRTLVAISLSRS